MKTCVFFILCILAFVSPQDARNTIPRSSSAISSLTRSHSKTPPSHTALPKNSGKVPTSSLTHRSHSAISSPRRSQNKLSSHKTVSVPTSSGRLTKHLPTISRPKTSVRPTITSHQKPNSPISRASSKTSKSSPLPTTTTNSTTTRHATVTTPPRVAISATKTLTVSNGQTASAQVGWMVMGAGIGGSVAVGGNILPVAGGSKGIIEAGSSGQPEVDSIGAATTPSRSTSKSSSSSSSSSTASPTPYNIYPKPGSTLPQQSAFAQDLERIAQPGSVTRITGGRDQLLLWVASLTPAQASVISRNPVVLDLNVDRPLPVDFGTKTASDRPPSPECPPDSGSCSHRKRDGTVLMQQHAPYELRVISQAWGASLSELPGYAYDSRGGRGITVYIIDTGINPNHEEFRNMHGSIRWLYLPGQPRIEGDNVGHGTCIASKIAGPVFGVAKSANIVVVRVDLVNGKVLPSSAIAALGVVARDITLNGLQGRAVINAAISFTASINRNYIAGLSIRDQNTYIAGIRELIDLDAVLVVSSGNIGPGRHQPELVTYPALLARIIPIIVVGGVDTFGIRGDYSQGLPEELTVSAVGGVVCASEEGGTHTSMWQGTSFAAPAVAGLAAYLLSLERYRGQLLVRGSVARNVRDLIRSLAYARVPYQPAVMWNGIDSREIYYCPVRRDAGSSGCPARNTTLPIVPPVIPCPNPPHPSTTTGMSTTSVTSSMTDSSTTSNNGAKTSSLSTTISANDGSSSSFTQTITIETTTTLSH